MEKPALLVIDMLKDNFDENHKFPITPFAKKLIGPINKTIHVFRKENWPIVFSTDAFHENDFIFKGRMRPHSLAGTPGAEVADELDRTEEDLWLPKPLFSAFFKTNLHEWLSEREITLCAVAGISTNVCVLTTVFDAVSHGFKAILLEDCTAASSESIHQHILSAYRRNALHPLLRVETSVELASGLTGKTDSE